MATYKYLDDTGLSHLVERVYGKINEAVAYTSQTLTTSQKTQARTNIGAAAANDVAQLQEVVDIATLSEVQQYFGI